MHPQIKNLLGVVCGLLVGSIANMTIVYLVALLIPPAVTGYDNSTMEGVNAMMLHMRPVDFLSPFLGHALGTFAGAIIAGLISPNSLRAALLVGVFFLTGGIYMVAKVDAPLWFEISDLVLAYLPMSLLAVKLVGKKKDQVELTSIRKG